MTRESLLFFILLVASQTNCIIATDTNHYCAPSSCGNILNISYPFRLQTDPINCGDFQYNLSCQNNITLLLYLHEGIYSVQAINYDNFTIRLVDIGIDKDNCSSIPRFDLSPHLFDYWSDPYSWYKYKWPGKGPYGDYLTEIEISGLPSKQALNHVMIFIKCLKPAANKSKSPALYLPTAPCIKGVNTNYTYYAWIGRMRASDLMDSCSIERVALFPAKDKQEKILNMSSIEIHRELAFGFELSWHNINCREKILWFTKKIIINSPCYLDSKNHIQFMFGGYYSTINLILLGLLAIILYYLGMFQAPRFLIGSPFVIAFLIYKWRRRHLSGYNNIEEFLQSHNNLMPVRYAYSDIRKTTKRFKEKLGEGGFGTVYKGKLRSGQLAAVKMLGKSNANGQDFINEVATIGRIHHANVVKLIGFCSEGSKHALIYEFMSNGSLNNYIFPRDESISLSWGKLYQISIGVAQGIEYLHRGCDMQILHFDIKPHNILLDENFIPKISDFGLAKFYPTKGSIASLTAARGTIGYMAPELFYRNIGRVSCKADVYSFGMLLLEMAGRRKNLNAMAENLSQIYYPFWVYDQLSNETLEIEDVTDEENEMARKMIITGLWCIQMQPCHRPSMNKVVEMLEGDLESLQLPPRPVLYPVESLTKDEGESSSMPVDFSESSSLIENLY